MISYENFRKGYFYSKENVTNEEEHHCKEAFERYSFKEYDDNFFEPSDEVFFAPNMINGILDITNIKENEIVILVEPSFEPSSIIVIRKETKVYNIDYKFFNKFIGEDNKIERQDLQNEKIIVEQRFGDKLWSLFDKVIIDAKKPQSGLYTLDGILYYLIKVINGKVFMVSKNLTDENTKTGQIINLIDKIGETIKSRSNIQNLENLIRHIDNMNLVEK